MAAFLGVFALLVVSISIHLAVVMAVCTELFISVCLSGMQNVFSTSSPLNACQTRQRTGSFTCSYPGCESARGAHVLAFAPKARICTQEPQDGSASDTLDSAPAANSHESSSGVVRFCACVNKAQKCTESFCFRCWRKRSSQGQGHTQAHEAEESSRQRCVTVTRTVCVFVCAQRCFVAWLSTHTHTARIGQKKKTHKRRRSPTPDGDRERSRSRSPAPERERAPRKASIKAREDIKEELEKERKQLHARLDTPPGSPKAGDDGSQDPDYSPPAEDPKPT